MYLNTLLYYTSIYFECCTNYIHSYFDKLGQFLNIYFELGLREDKIYYATVINQIVKNELIDKLDKLGLDTFSLRKLVDIREFKKDEIEILKESYK